MQKDEFIENRHAALEKYLGKLVAHPVLRQSDELCLFLQVELFGEGSTILAPHDAAQPVKGGRDLVRLFKELKQSVTNDWGNTRPAIIEEDIVFFDKKEKLQDLEHHQVVMFPNRSVGEASARGGEVMGELGLTFSKVAKFEMDAGFTPIHAANAKCVATRAVKASCFYWECTA
ncbi:unnamed protein product [Sphagnum compactum]